MHIVISIFYKAEDFFKRNVCSIAHREFDSPAPGPSKLRSILSNMMTEHGHGLNEGFFLILEDNRIVGRGIVKNAPSVTFYGEE
jgi:hypothetical protein